MKKAFVFTVMALMGMVFLAGCNDIDDHVFSFNNIVKLLRPQKFYDIVNLT